MLWEVCVILHLERLTTHGGCCQTSPLPALSVAQVWLVLTNENASVHQRQRNLILNFDIISRLVISSNPEQVSAVMMWAVGSGLGGLGLFSRQMFRVYV